MAGTHNSISTMLAQFMRLENNALSILSKLNEATTSTADAVIISQTNSTGTNVNYSVPSFGYIKSELRRLDNNTQALAGLGENSAFLRMPDGTIKKVFASEALTDTQPITTVNTPKNFKIKNNWFFESFLNPLLYVGLDVTGQVPDDMARAVVKRIIVAADNQEIKDWFDLNYKGKNDVDYLSFLKDLTNNNIGFFVDEEISDMPVAVMQYKGSFDVLKMMDEQVTLTSGTGTISTKKRKYKLHKLTYTDITTGLTDTKTLKNGDQLITNDGSRYVIDSVDNAENTVVLTMTSGNQSIGAGVGVLNIYSQPYRNKEIQVGVGHDERQVVFVKPIEPKFNVASSTFSPGTAFWTNELTISTTDGIMSLDTFYKGQVSDFGLQFIQQAKERTVPAVYGEIPDYPIVDATNFKVVQINGHITDQKEVDTIKKQLASKVQLENEIAQIDQSINQKKNDLNNNASSKSDSERAKIQSDLTALASERLSKVNLYTSVVNSIATAATQNPSSATTPEFRVRGYFPLPTPKTSTKTNPQECVQFITAYRKLRKDGNAPAAQQISFTDTDGNSKTGTFPNWVEIKSPLRERVYNELTGFYEWAIEDVAHPEKNNINQIDIPIQGGEQIEIKIKTVSEAGWPINPLVSDWSPSVIIDFPEELQTSADLAQLLANAQAEDTRVKFTQDLASKGLDLHLLSSFTNADKYYSHKADDIASGYFTQEGKVINLFEKLKSMDSELQRLNALITKAKGTLVVYLLDDTGNITKVTPNQTIQLFAGFYKSLIQTGTNTYDHGKIITKVYTVRLENSAASSLELASYLPGGLNELASGTTQDYLNNRMYADVPMSLTSITGAKSGALAQVAPFQSAQVKSQWIYCRKRSVGLDTDLYVSHVLADGGINPNNTSALYDYLGKTNTLLGSSVRIPVNGQHLVPFNPTSPIPSPTTDPNVWNGSTDGSALPVGGGYRSEFCIHTSHPAISSLGASYTWIPDLFGTAPISGANDMSYLKFVHSLYFSDDITSQYGKQQLNFIAPGSLDYQVGSTPTAVANNFPAKLGFHKDDYYLIGKYTCGSYLYLAPTDYNTNIAVDGSTATSKKMLLFGEDKSINIPLVFQIRASDILGNVGGYRTTGPITNVTYAKKIGIDIQIMNDTMFSFDVEVTSKYDQDSLVGPTYIPNIALDRLSSIRTQSI